MIKELYDIAEKNGIEIHDFPMRAVESMSVPGGIAIDRKKMKDTRDELTHLAHEMGHCMTNSFYSIYCKFDLRSKHEYKANKWAIENLIPFSRLLPALQNGITEKWQLAEHFNVTEDLMEKALQIYEADLIKLRTKEMDE